MKMRQLLAVVVTLCMVFSLLPLSAVAATEEVVCLDIQDGDLFISSTGYSYNGVNVPFTGRYVLCGTPCYGIYITEGGTYDITVHDLDATAEAYYSSLSLEAADPITLNLTVEGINIFSGDNHPGLTGDPTAGHTVNLTLEENSSVLFSRQGITPGAEYSVATGITLQMADGSPLPGVDTSTEDWRQVSLTLTNGTPAAHDGQCVATEAGHYYTCSVCDAMPDKVMEHYHEDYYYTVDKDTCGLFCEVCGYLMGDALPHDMTYYSIYDEKNCIAKCDRCGYTDEALYVVPHVFNGNISITDTTCSPVCDHCGYYSEAAAVEHTFDEGTAVSATDLQTAHTRYACVDCGYFYKEYGQESKILFTLTSEYGDAWEDSGLLVYVNGKPTQIVRYMDPYAVFPAQELYAIPYDATASYVFKWINNGTDSEYGLTVTVSGADAPLFERAEMSPYGMLQTVCTLNMADYTAVDAALVTVPAAFEAYTPDSVAALVTALKGVVRMLPAGEQTKVDSMAAAITAAVAGLTENLDGEMIPHGVINIAHRQVDIYNDEDGVGYALCVAVDGDWVWYDHEGDYVIVDSNPKESENEAYADSYVDIYSGKINIDLVNAYMVGDNFSPFNIWEPNCDVTVTLYGANASTSTWGAGMFVNAGSKLTIADSEGSMVAIGDSDSAGIGGYEDYYQNDDGTYDYDYRGCGEITIDGGTIFALAESDGAGIGTANNGELGKITINGGYIWAESMKDDGAGIGVGDGGFGGDIVINGGRIWALGLDDDGGGLGGADEGHVDSITINGGDITVGSEDAAGVGGGQESNGCGKIIINGGIIRPHENHDPKERLVGFGEDVPQGVDPEANFVQINGGTILDDGYMPISPAPTNKDGVALVKVTLPVHEDYNGLEVILQLSNDSTYVVVADNSQVMVYLPEDVTVTNAAQLLLAPGSVLYGDVDENGTVAAADALLALQIATNKVIPSDTQTKAADVDGKEGVSASDALLILQFATKKITVFPVEDK